MPFFIRPLWSHESVLTCIELVQEQTIFVVSSLIPSFPRLLKDGSCIFLLIIGKALHSLKEIVEGPFLNL